MTDEDLSMLIVCPEQSLYTKKEYFVDDTTTKFYFARHFKIALEADRAFNHLS